MDPNAGLQARDPRATDTSESGAKAPNGHARPRPRLLLLTRRTSPRQRVTVLAWLGKT